MIARKSCYFKPRKFCKGRAKGWLHRRAGDLAGKTQSANPLSGQNPLGRGECPRPSACKRCWAVQPTPHGTTTALTTPACLPAGKESRCSTRPPDHNTSGQAENDHNHPARRAQACLPVNHLANPACGQSRKAHRTARPRQSGSRAQKAEAKRQPLTRRGSCASPKHQLLWRATCQPPQNHRNGETPKGQSPCGRTQPKGATCPRANGGRRWRASEASQRTHKPKTETAGKVSCGQDQRTTNHDFMVQEKSSDRLPNGLR
jgi:hypothetical protein